MARWAKRVVAIDNNPEALTAARERAAREGLDNIVFLREDLHRLSLPDGRKDLVVLSQSLHHVEDPEAVVREAARILKSGGKMTLLELLPHEERWVQERLGHRHLGFEPGALERLLKKAGFSALDHETHPREAASSFRVFRLTGVKR